MSNIPGKNDIDTALERLQQVIKDLDMMKSKCIFYSEFDNAFFVFGPPPSSSRDKYATRREAEYIFRDMWGLD